MNEIPSESLSRVLIYESRKIVSLVETSTGPKHVRASFFFGTSLRRTNRCTNPVSVTACLYRRRIFDARELEIPNTRVIVRGDKWDEAIVERTHRWPTFRSNSIVSARAPFAERARYASFISERTVYRGAYRWPATRRFISSRKRIYSRVWDRLLTLRGRRTLRAFARNDIRVLFPRARRSVCLSFSPALLSDYRVQRTFTPFRKNYSKRVSFPSSIENDFQYPFEKHVG